MNTAETPIHCSVFCWSGTRMQQNGPAQLHFPVQLRGLQDVTDVGLPQPCSKWDMSETSPLTRYAENIFTRCSNHLNCPWGPDPNMQTKIILAICTCNLILLVCIHKWKSGRRSVDKTRDVPLAQVCFHHDRDAVGTVSAPQKALLLPAQRMLTSLYSHLQEKKTLRNVMHQLIPNLE